MLQEEKANKVLGRYGSAIKEVDINLSVSKGKGDQKQKCELTVFTKRLGVVRPPQAVGQQSFSDASFTVPDEGRSLAMLASTSVNSSPSL